MELDHEAAAMEANSNIILTSGVLSGATRLSSDERNTFASRWVGGLLMYPRSLFAAPTTVLLCSIVSVKLLRHGTSKYFKLFRGLP